MTTDLRETKKKLKEQLEYLNSQEEFNSWNLAAVLEVVIESIIDIIGEE